MPSRVLVVGESLVDVVIAPGGSTIDTRPGGAPLNIAVGLARLDVPTLLLTTYGDDAHGRLVAEHAAASGVEVLDGAVSPLPTSVARALLDETNQATYEFELHWNPGRVELPDDLAVLHIGSLGTVVGPGDETVRLLVEEAIAVGVPVTYDPNVRPAISTDAEAAAQGVRRWSAQADVVKMSDADAAYLLPGAGIDEVLDEVLAGDRTALGVVTLGPEGTVLANRHHRVRLPAPEVDVVDTVGAGDSFMSGLIAGLLDRDFLGPDRLGAMTDAELAAVGEWAATIASITCSRRGADPPRRAELPG